MTTTNTPRSTRKTTGIFNAMVNSINSFEIGETYKVADMRKRMTEGRYNTERVGDYHLDLLSTNCIVRVKRGYYKVLGKLPEFLTLNMCEANRGYTFYEKNPEFLGYINTTDKTQPGYYKSINGIPANINVPRGKKWKLGEPNPFITVVENNDGEKPIWLAVRIIAGNDRHNEYLKALNCTTSLHDIIATTEMGTKFIINRVDKDIDGEYLAYGNCNGVIVKVYFFDIISIECVYKEINKTKKEQIIEILKMGLSANDAAELIVKL